MKGLLRAVVMAMMLSMMGGLAAPSGSAAVAQEDAAQPVGMVSGPWRMMAWQFAFAPAFPEQGLEAREGSNWGVLVADITNTGVDSALPVVDVKLGDSEVSGDGARSVAVSQSLGFTGLGADGVLPVAENGIARVAVVMDIPEGVGSPAIQIGDEVVSVESVMTDSLDLNGLPAEQTAMQLQVGTIQNVTSAASFDVTLDSGQAREITLQGIVPPDQQSCHAATSNQLVTDVTVGTVWIETVSGIDAPTVWVNDAATASFALLDQRLVEAGAVEVVSTDSSASSVYSNWLSSKAVAAEASGAGLHGACAPAPTPSAEEVRDQYALITTQELIARPFLFEGQMIAVSGEVFTLQVDQDGTFMQIWVDTPTGQEAVVVGFLGNQTPGLYEGMYVTVYGVGAGTFEGTNSFGGVISQPVILADIVDY